MESAAVSGVNGSPSNQMEYGLRQGDFIAPFLFFQLWLKA